MPAAPFAVQHEGRDLTPQSGRALCRHEKGVIVIKSVKFHLVSVRSEQKNSGHRTRRIKNVIHKCALPQSKFDKLDLVLHSSAEVL